MWHDSITRRIGGARGGRSVGGGTRIGIDSSSEGTEAYRYRLCSPLCYPRKHHDAGSVHSICLTCLSIRAMSSLDIWRGSAALFISASRFLR